MLLVFFPPEFLGWRTLYTPSVGGGWKRGLWVAADFNQPTAVRRRSRRRRRGSSACRRPLRRLESTDSFQKRERVDGSVSGRSSPALPAARAGARPRRCLRREWLRGAPGPGITVRGVGARARRADIDRRDFIAGQSDRERSSGRAVDSWPHRRGEDLELLQRCLVSCPRERGPLQGCSRWPRIYAGNGRLATVLDRPTRRRE